MNCSQEHLLLYMQDLKEEGNAFFKEEDYQNAWMFYSKAVNVAMDLRMHHYENVDHAFLSALFSNRAMCCLRQVRKFEYFSSWYQSVSQFIKVIPMS